ncbi:hypothetical protein C2E21_5063 [Chlorella sorokiniana]|uniref:FHA domain-containing protein n=1 Tax=Chlorella sorokiniana TaxID=3076 RepID=A0A2P6TQJ3_CHLSO|nr:hypothetical protein C2E21_5063 [Chlorella sorokiniana]|eukprot:PRW56301.1 hypothetical protein C2E21_5063 [Chlorella sorokiniana]
MAATVYAQQQAHAALMQQQQQHGCMPAKFTLGSPSGGSAGSGGGPPSAEPCAPSLVRPGKDAASADSPGGTPTSPLSKQRGAAGRQPAAERRRSARQPKRPAAGEAAAPPARRPKKQQQQPAASDGDGTHGSYASGTQTGAQGLPPLSLQTAAPGAAAGMIAALPIDLPDLDGLGDLDDLPGLDDLLIDEALQGAPLSIADPWASADPWAHLSAPLPSPAPHPPPAAPPAQPLLPPAVQPPARVQPLGVPQPGVPGAPNTFAAQLQQQGQPVFVPQGPPGMGPGSASAVAVHGFNGQAPGPAAAAAGSAAPLAALQAFAKPGQLSKRSESARALLTAAVSARLRRMQQQQAAVAAARAAPATQAAPTAPPPAIPQAAVVAPVVSAAAAVTRPQHAAGPLFSGPLSGEAQLMIGRQPSGPVVQPRAPAGQLLLRDPSILQPVKRGTLHPPRRAFDSAVLQLSAAAPLVAAGRAAGSPGAADASLLRCVFGSALQRAPRQLQTGRRAAQLRVAAAAAAGGSAPPVKLELPGGTTVAMPSSSLVLGSAADADLQLEGSGVAAQHARLEWKGGRLFCTALSADPDLLLAPTNCWLDGVELRPGVSYMVAPGARLAVGTQDNSLAFAFQEGGSSAMTEMLMKGLAASASKEVQDKLQGM